MTTFTALHAASTTTRDKPILTMKLTVQCNDDEECDNGLPTPFVTQLQDGKRFTIAQLFLLRGMLRSGCIWGTQYMVKQFPRLVLMAQLSRSRELIDLRDWKRFPVMRGGYKQTVISEDQTAKARRSASEKGVRRSEESEQ